MAWTSDETKMDTGQLYVTTDGGETYHKVCEIKKISSSIFPRINSWDDALYKYMLDSLRLQEENLKVKEYLFGTPKYVLAGDYIPFEWLNGNANLGLIKPYCKIELFKEKENKTMDRKPEARKCERCGKLFEVSTSACYFDQTNTINIINKTIEPTFYEKRNFKDEIIDAHRTETIRICNDNSDNKDESTATLCPECRASLKQWWENPDKILVDAYGEPDVEEAKSNG